MRVTIWNENVHESINPAVAEIYPEGIHGALAAALTQALPEASIRTATLQEPGHGLGDGVLASTDVMLWWGHLAHDQVADEVAEAVQQAVLQGMGLIVLHSGHLSKVFTRLMGTTCNLRWREADDREVIWQVMPSHPIAAGVAQPMVLAQHEMYGEFFDIPTPDELVFISSFSGGEVFRSGCCFNRGKGRIFYFSPGHETYPIYHQPQIIRVLANAVRWAHVSEPAAIETGTSPESPRGWYEPR